KKVLLFLDNEPAVLGELKEKNGSRCRSSGGAPMGPGAGRRRRAHKRRGRHTARPRGGAGGEALRRGHKRRTRSLARNQRGRSGHPWRLGSMQEDEGRSS
uniref:Uncharacterized protein n=3 Tax=Aegilops tauschii subsp. strangulata TaxID=200361 RepID=A0A453HAI2_AEGTS